MRFSRRNPNRVRRPQPDFIEPKKALLVDKAPTGDGWLHEMKVDGYRAAAVISNGQVRMFSRNAHDWSAKFDPLPASLAKVKVKSAYLDGEVAVLTADGLSDFEALQEALGRTRNGNLTYIVFDILEKDGRDLRELPLIERKAILGKLLAKPPAGIQYSEHIVGRGPEFFRAACQKHLEGVVSKRADSPYRSGRGGDWVKTKCVSRQEFVVGGYRYSINGTGWSIKLGKSIMAAVQRNSRETSPFVAVPRADARDAKWADPKLVAEVQFTTWTRDGRVRHPSFKGLGGQASEVGEAGKARLTATPGVTAPFGSLLNLGVPILPLDEPPGPINECCDFLARHAVARSTEDPPITKAQAIELGRQQGATARDLALPPDFFKRSLEFLIQTWSLAGCNAAWIDAGEVAARAAYFGETLSESTPATSPPHQETADARASSGLPTPNSRDRLA